MSSSASDDGFSLLAWHHGLPSTASVDGFSLHAWRRASSNHTSIWYPRGLLPARCRVPSISCHLAPPHRQAFCPDRALVRHSASSQHRRHTRCYRARGRATPSHRPPPTALCLPCGRPRCRPGPSRPPASASSPRWTGFRRAGHPFSLDSCPDAISNPALGAVHSPWCLLRSTTLTTFPCHLPVCRAASRPQGQGVAVRGALSLRAAQRPSSRLAGCQPATATSSTSPAQSGPSSACRPT